jgi:alkanesulfonate monooxygenase SsuD/methylene tetrahydromethanopterin reductase-like flavin-dependent oxidoreductase (luciferase family)
MLDEGLAVLDRFWSGEMVTHHGQHYDVENVSLAPLPFQRPRIPIWIGGESPPALRRAARWDGWLAPTTSPDGTPIMDKDPGRIAEMVADIRRHRAHAYEAAGATWWLESIHDMRGSLDEMIARVEAGPPEPR